MFNFYRIFLIISILSPNVYCGNQIKPGEKETSVYTPEIKNSNEYEDISPKHLADTTVPKKNIDLREAKSIRILSITKERLFGDTSDEYYGNCKKYFLTGEEHNQ